MILSLMFREQVNNMRVMKKTMYSNVCMYMDFVLIFTSFTMNICYASTSYKHCMPINEWTTTLNDFISCLNTPSGVNATVEDAQKLRKALSRVLEKTYEKLHQGFTVLYDGEIFNYIQPSFNYKVVNISGANSKEIVQNLLSTRLTDTKIFFLICTIECEVEILKAAGANTGVNNHCNVWLTMKNEVMELDLNGTVNLLKIDAGMNSVGNDVNLKIIPSKDRVSEDVSYILPIVCNKRVLRVAIAESMPLIFQNRDTLSGDMTCSSYSKVCKTNISVDGIQRLENKCCYGLFIDILMRLEIDMNFESDLYLVNDGYFGKHVNGTWNGIVGDLINNKADIGLALSIKSERSHFIDFSDPFLADNIAIITTAEKDSTFNLQLHAPFKTNLWIVSFLALFVICFLLFVFERIGSNGSANFTYVDSLEYVVGLCIGKEIGALNPNIISARVIAISIAIGTMVLISSYIAVMTANFAEHQINPVVSGFLELVNKRDSIKHGMYGSTSYSAHFKQSPDQQFRSLYASSHKYQSLDEGMKMLNAGKLQAFVYSEAELKYYFCQDDQSILYIPNEVIKLTGVSVALQKGSKLNPEISKWARTYKLEGLLKQYEDKWLKRICPTRYQNVPVIDVKVFSVAFIMLLVGLIFSLLVALAEMLYQIIKTKKNVF